MQKHTSNACKTSGSNGLTWSRASSYCKPVRQRRAAAAMTPLTARLPLSSQSQPSRSTPTTGIGQSTGKQVSALFSPSAGSCACICACAARPVCPNCLQPRTIHGGLNLLGQTCASSSPVNLSTVYNSHINSVDVIQILQRQTARLQASLHKEEKIILLFKQLQGERIQLQALALTKPFFILLLYVAQGL